MRNLFIYLLIFCALGIGPMLQAQNIGHYKLTEKIKVGSLTAMNGSRQLIGPGKFETSSQVQSIGFDFIFMGRVYNSFSVNANGVLRLGEEQVLAGANTYGIPGNDRIVPMAGVSVEYRYRACFIGCWDAWRGLTADLQTSSTGKVHYKVEGNAPNKVLTIEWKDMTFREGYQTAKTTFQVKLYESATNSSGNGRIEFLYGEFDLKGDYRNFTFRSGFGIGPEAGNFVAIDHSNQSLVNERNFSSGPVSNNISYFRPQDGNNLLYRFEADRKPVGTFSNFAVICPAPNALTIRFEENCPDEAGIAVYRKIATGNGNTPFTFVTSLPPDARTFSDGGVGLGASYIYRFYLLGESHYADTYTEFVTEPVRGGIAFQAIRSGKWTNSATWGAGNPSSIDDVEIGCSGSVFVSADGNAQVRNLTIQKGSFLTIEDGMTLSVSGDFVNNGVFNPIGSGRLLLNGNTPQSVTNTGQGITNDSDFTSNNNRPEWNADKTGLVASKSINVTETGFSAIKKVGVNITHNYLRDLSVYLRTPNGQRILLAKGRGQQGSNYTNVVFIETGKPLPPTVQNFDLAGEYMPETSLATYEGPFNGTWYLEVEDAMDGVGGRLNSFTLTLSKGGSNDLVMQSITIDNSSEEGVTLQSGIVVQRNLQLAKGVLHSKETAPVLLEAGASCNAGNAHSFVDGPVLKKGNTNFVFPLGNEGKWAPLGIEGVRNGNANTTFRASYTKNNAPSADQLGTNVQKVSSLEYWDLSPTAGSPSVDIVLYWKDGQESDIIDISSGDLMVAHYTNGQWKNEGGEIVAGSKIGAGGAGAIKARNISTFSPFTFGSETGINPLPVELLSFTGRVEKGAVELSWTTASEMDNSHFEIQKSANAHDWQQVGKVEGNGTTHLVQNYSFRDREVLNGKSFYRLKQVDFDGKFEYSSIVAVESLAIPKAGILEISPNPASGHFTVQISSFPAELVLWNQNGTKILTTTLQGLETSVPLPGLAAGLYLVTVKDASGFRSARLIISTR